MATYIARIEEILALTPWHEVPIATIFDGLIAYSGVDGEGLVTDDILDILDRSSNDDWYNLYFACASCVAICASTHDTTPEGFVYAVVSVLVVAEASRRGIGDSSLSFDSFLDILIDDRHGCDVEFRMAVLTEVLRRG